jgi:hypothetical protein
MAKAAFFVNDLKIVEKGKFLVLEARRQCEHGHVIDQVFLTLPAELGKVLAELSGTQTSGAETPDSAPRSVWHNRLEQYFDREN